MLFSRLWWTVYLGARVIGQAGTPFKPRAVIRRAQSRRVQRLVAYAYRSVPYYRETLDRLNLKPADFKTAEDLARLPILERRQIQESPEQFTSSAVRLSRCLILCTGGSAGTPLTVPHDLRSVLDVLGHQERYRSVLSSIIGRRRRYRETWIFPPQSSPHKVRRYWWDRTFRMNRIIPDKQFLSMVDPPEKIVPLLNDYQPDAIHSYGSYIEELFAYLSAQAVPFARPKVVGFGADGLSESARRMIREQFGLECFSSYNAVEAWRIAFECPEHRGLHINEDYYPLRVVDPAGQTVPPGQPGDVIVSNLVNRAMVFLNYRLGDIAALVPEPCPCGRTLPLMSYPIGRRDDWVELPTGERLHPQAVHTLLREESAVWQYQVTQESPLSFRVSLLAKESCDRERTRVRLTAKFAQAFGDKAHIDVVFVSSIPRTAAGKIRPVISLRKETEIAGGAEKAT